MITAKGMVIAFLLAGYLLGAGAAAAALSQVPYRCSFHKVYSAVALWPLQAAMRAAVWSVNPSDTHYLQTDCSPPTEGGK